jgi:membrane-associated phospholipid phosphatase
MTVQRRVVLAGTALAAFAVGVTLAVLTTGHNGVVERLDQSWHASLRSFFVGHAGWLSTMRVITHFGDTVTIGLVDLVLFGVCLYRGRRRLAVFVAVVAGGGWALRIGARDLIARPRPADALWPAEGFSFPSGHATNTALMAILVVFVCWTAIRPAGRWALLAAAGVYALAVGFSRIAGGVHWPSDVLAGWLLATAIACGAAAGFPWPAPTEEPSPHGLPGRPAARI